MQKKTTVIKILYAILLLATIAVKPLATVGYVAYYELNVDYIIEKYCINKSKPKLKCNGKCHLSKQLSFSTLEKETKKQPANYSVIESLFPLFFSKESSCNFIWNTIEFIPQIWFYSLKSYISYLSISVPPPKGL